jgi:hypothetical protein
MTGSEKIDREREGRDVFFFMPFFIFFLGSQYWRL